MNNKVELQPAWLLHSRPYRDTSALLDFHTRDHGRLSLIAKGLRRPNSKLRGLVQPFVPLLISWQGRSSLKTLIAAEAGGNSMRLAGEALFSGMYLNELLSRLLHDHEGDEFVFTLYSETLESLTRSPMEPVLRVFESELLESLGYGLSFEYDAHSGEQISPDAFYRLDLQSGFIRAPENTEAMSLYSGQVLLDLADRKFYEEDVRRAAKHINRLRLSALLGDKPLKSRRLFSARLNRDLTQQPQGN